MTIRWSGPGRRVWWLQVESRAFAGPAIDRHYVMQQDIRCGDR